MVVHVLAGLGLAVCLLLLLDMALGARRRALVRAWLRLQWQRLRRLPHRQRERQAAEAAAAQAIDRARRAVVEREGNVYRPRSFDRRPPDDKLH